ncbi:MAG: hypothetical protein HZB29_07925 [Nitrospinae bacterium]|nr:hypothetical protein [Nitrospinota bacterium]
MRKKAVFLAAFWVIMIFTRMAASSYAGDVEEERLWISLDVFPRIVSVDQELAKKVSPGGAVKLLLLYGDKKETAEKAGKYLKKRLANISGFPVEITLDNKPSCAGYTAMMLTEKLNDQLFQKALGCAVENGIILFSPYDDDVPRGATASVLIKIKVEPYFNKNTLAKSHLQINKTVLKFSSVYE